MLPRFNGQGHCSYPAHDLSHTVSFRAFSYLRTALLASLVAAVVCSSTAATALAQPGDYPLLYDDFESGGLSNWTVNTKGEGTADVRAGIGRADSRGVRLTVPSYGTNSLAYLRHTTSSPQRGISATGWFKVAANGCSGDGTYSNGNLPFFRFFDSNGKRIAGLYRINANCSKTAKLYVQHSRNFYRTGKNISRGSWYRLELRITASNPGESLVEVYVNGQRVYVTRSADNGVLPIASVTTHNEHPDQVGDLIADEILLAGFDAPAPVDPCAPGSTPAPSSSMPGTTVVADNFETVGFPQWTRVTRLGDASVNLEPRAARTGNCGALISVSAATGSKGNLLKDLTGGTKEIWAEGSFSVLKAGANASSNVPFLRLFEGGSRLVDVYRVNGSGALYMRVPDGAGGVRYVSLGRSISVDRWHEIKLHAQIDGADSRVGVWLDGGLLRSVSVPSLAGSTFGEAMVGSEHFAQEGKLAVDDLVIKKVP